MTRPHCATDGPRKPLTDQQRKIADGIRRNLSYKEIAAELGCAEQTVRHHVRAMALLFEDPSDLPPRMMVFVWMKHVEWTALKQAAIA